MDIRLLPIYSNNQIDIDLIKTAKEKIDCNFKVQLCKAVPGSPGRVLAIGSKPPFLCDYALVQQPTVERLQAALEWILELREDTRGMTILKKMKQIFGEETIEVTDGIASQKSPN